jgi:hypothetical protein
MALQSTTVIKVTLNAEQWNTVLSLLAETGPYRVVNPLVSAIMQQCLAFDEQHQIPIPDEHTPEPISNMFEVEGPTGVQQPRKVNGAHL